MMVHVLKKWLESTEAIPTAKSADHLKRLPYVLPEQTTSSALQIRACHGRRVYRNYQRPSAKRIHALCHLPSTSHSTSLPTTDWQEGSCFLVLLQTAESQPRTEVFILTGSTKVSSRYQSSFYTTLLLSTFGTCRKAAKAGRCLSNKTLVERRSFGFLCS
jgi:hypothetical protein